MTEDNEKTKSSKGVSRREFITGAVGSAAVLGAMTALVPGVAAATTNPAAMLSRTADPVPVPSSWDVPADVVVVGGGVAGLVTAVEASSKGASVVLLEESDVLGGTSINHGGLWCIWGLTDYQKSQNITYGPLDTRANFYNLLAYGREEVLNLDVVNLVIDNSLAAAQWYESIGGSFTGLVTTSKMPFLPSRNWIVRSANGGWGYAQVLANNCSKNGVNIVMNARGLQLITNPTTGEVIGVYALVNNQQVQSFQAKRAVVLATGSFVWNAEMTQQYNGYGVGENTYCVRQEDVGDGIRMAQAVGADLWGMQYSDCTATSTKPTSTPVIAPRLPTAAVHPPFNSISVGGTVAGIFVNKYGNRFYDESMGNVGWICANQEQEIVWAVFDSAAIATLGGTGVCPIFDPNIQNEVAAGNVIEANTLADLDTALGISPPGNLVTTINNYNAGAAKGVDPQFGKNMLVAPIATPPFYATRVIKGSLMSFGGLRTNVNAEILDTAGNPIPRLYGVGRVTGGYMAKWYPSGGSTFPEMTVLGRIAGDNAAALTPWTK